MGPMSTTFSLVVYVNPPHARPNRPRTIRMIPSVLFMSNALLLQYLFDLSDFLLDLAGDLFGLAFGFQVGIVRHLSRGLLYFAFQLMKFALDLILRTRFHMSCSFLLSNPRPRYSGLGRALSASKLERT